MTPSKKAPASNDRVASVGKGGSGDESNHYRRHHPTDHHHHLEKQKAQALNNQHTSLTTESH